MSLLGQKIIKKKLIDKKLSELDFIIGNNKEYKVQTIQDSTVYTNEMEDYLLSLCYLVA